MELFVQVLLVAKEAGALKLGNISLDGSKVHADASKSKAISYKRLLKLERQLRAEVEELFTLSEFEFILNRDFLTIMTFVQDLSQRLRDRALCHALSILKLPTRDVALADAERQALLEQFSRSGRFACVEKAVIAAHITTHPEIRNRLQTLNDLLRPYNLHFGYRVFDEIVAFLAAAEENDLYANLGGMEAAFDAAVLMKVLPKFHGSRGKLERPLQAVLAWCVNPESPDLASVRQKLERIDSTTDLEAVWEKLTFRLSATARRVQRMMGSLYTTDFAAFG